MTDTRDLDPLDVQFLEPWLQAKTQRSYNDLLSALKNLIAAEGPSPAQTNETGRRLLEQLLVLQSIVIRMQEATEHALSGQAHFLGKLDSYVAQQLIGTSDDEAHAKRTVEESLEARERAMKAFDSAAEGLAQFFDNQGSGLEAAVVRRLYLNRPDEAPP